MKRPPPQFGCNFHACIQSQPARVGKVGTSSHVNMNDGFNQPACKLPVRFLKPGVFAVQILRPKVVVGICVRRGTWQLAWRKSCLNNQRIKN
jgi:hypothetical protein